MILEGELKKYAKLSINYFCLGLKLANIYEYTIGCTVRHLLKKKKKQ